MRHAASQIWAKILRKPQLTILMLVGLAIPVAALSMFQGRSSDWLSQYAEATPTDAIARLQQKMDSGEVKFQFDENWGYLKSVLNALNVPASSQSLVFSRTSFQLDKIAPWNPRAIYFNDDVYVGWVQGGPVLEFASVDPKLGAVFYTMNQKADSPPKFERQVFNCLQCHDAMANTGGVPGFMVQSVYVDRYGYPLASAHNPVTSDRTALRERFGGWYVTGKQGDQLHMGNVIASKAASEIGNTDIYLAGLNLATTGNISDLSKFFRTDHYISSGSDIVAMMLLVHQTSLHTLMIQATADPRLEGSYTKVESLVQALLFCREAPLTAPLKGSDQFVADFSRAGPRDHKGRSLRDLDLNHRLLKYPLSYLIYSEGFDSMPERVKGYVSKRLGEILTGKDQSPAFAHISQSDRDATLEILQDTKPGFLNISTSAAQ